MGKKVLIVDDSPNTRGILRFMLGSLGFELLEAEDAERALKIVRAQAPDLIVLDVMMPGRSGFEVCQELKEDPRTSAIPIIVLSAIAQSDPGRDWGKESQADKFIAKPFRTADLLAAIESLLGVPPSHGAAQAESKPDTEPKGTVIRPGKHGLL
jgi:CheY-like chemotaxis protein